MDPLIVLRPVDFNLHCLWRRSHLCIQKDIRRSFAEWTRGGGRSRIRRRGKDDLVEIVSKWTNRGLESPPPVRTHVPVPLNTAGSFMSPCSDWVCEYRERGRPRGIPISGCYEAKDKKKEWISRRELSRAKWLQIYFSHIISFLLLLLSPSLRRSILWGLFVSCWCWVDGVGVSKEGSNVTLLCLWYHILVDPWSSWGWCTHKETEPSVIETRFGCTKAILLLRDKGTERLRGERLLLGTFSGSSFGDKFA